MTHEQLRAWCVLWIGVGAGVLMARLFPSLLYPFDRLRDWLLRRR